MICDSYKDAAAELSRPFTPEAIRWKFQSLWPKDGEPKGGLVVAYIDAGLVVSRLNLLVPHLWSDRYEDLGKGGLMRCWLTVDGITREDVGEGGSLKARYSDSLKRAAVKFGVGVSLRRVPQSKLQAGRLATAWARGDKRGMDFTQDGLNYLRQRYREWLDAQGRAAFGDALNHGDTGDAQGDEDADPGQVADEAATGSLLEALAGGEFTRKQQRGLLAAAGVTGLPEQPTPEQIAQAVVELTEEQVEKLALLIETSKQRAVANA